MKNASQNYSNNGRISIKCSSNICYPQDEYFATLYILCASCVYIYSFSATNPLQKYEILNAFIQKLRLQVCKMAQLLFILRKNPLLLIEKSCWINWKNQNVAQILSHHTIVSYMKLGI